MTNKMIAYLKSLNEKQIVVLLIGITFGLRLYAALMARGIAYDSAAYGFMARDFIKGEIFKGLSSSLHPLYPFLISLVCSDTGHVEIAGRLVSVFWGTLTLLPVYFLSKEILCPRGAFLSGLFYSLHPYLVTYSGMLLSEATYWGLLILSTYFFWTGLKKEKTWKISLSGIFLGLAYLTRPEGIGYLLIFLIWIVVDGLLNKKWFRMVFSAGVLTSIVLLLIIPYIIYIHKETGQWLISKKAIAIQNNILKSSKVEVNHPTEKSIEERDLGIIRVGKNVIRYLPFTTYHYLRAYHFTLWIFLLIGLVRVRTNGQREELFIASLVVFHLVSLSTFTNSTIRYSIPLIPLSLFWAGGGVLELRKWMGRVRESRPERWVSLILALTFTIQLVQALRPERKHREEQKKVGLWLKQNTAKNSIIMSNSPQEVFYADREFVLMPEEILSSGNPEIIYSNMIRYAKEKGVHYILIDPNTFKTISYPNTSLLGLKEIYRLSKKDGGVTFIYEVLY